MKWYYEAVGGHTHVRVFMNRENCGSLVFRNEEFERIRCDVDKLGAALDALVGLYTRPEKEQSPSTRIIRFIPEANRGADDDAFKL